MHLDLGGREVPIAEAEEMMAYSRGAHSLVERVKVGVVAENLAEKQQYQRCVERARRSGLYSTDGHGRVMNRWRVINATTRQLFSGGGAPLRYCLDLDLEQLG